MGNALSSCPCRKHRISSLREITLLMVGLDNAGKTCTAKHLVGENTADIVPTMGFSCVKIPHGKFQITIYDLGGGPKIRGIWKSYYALVHGVIFVVDASDPVRLDECRSEISDMLKNEKVSGKPILLLVNKNDVDGAMDETELVDQLELESLVNKQKCPTRVEASCALWEKGVCKDRGIQEGFNWIIGHICNDFARLNERVVKEREEQKAQEEKEKFLREERVRKLREEREQQEAMQNHLDADCVSNDDDSDVIIGNPFKPVSELKAEIDKREQIGIKSECVPPGAMVIHVSPSHSNTQNVNYGCEANSVAAVSSEMRILENTDDAADPEIPVTGKAIKSSSLHHLPKAKECSEKRKSRKAKKRFRNRVNPDVSEFHGNSYLSRPVELPPIKSCCDVIPNGHFISHLSPYRSVQNGKINWALAEELTPCEEKVAT